MTRVAEVDLHLHTTFSDGTLTPSQLVRLCDARGLSVIAISDHDSTDGIPEALEAARDIPHIAVISAIELSTDVPGSEIHLLGYYVDRDDATLQSTLLRFRDDREKRARRMVEKLHDVGVDVSWERVQELSGGAIGRPHIAQAMVEAGYVRYPKDAFDRYIGRNGPAYVERARMTPVEAVQALVANGAVPVMAHPIYFISSTEPDEVAKLKRTLSELKEAGLAGMEVYYGDYPPDQVELLRAISDEIGLVPCGGSDYHASGNPDEPEPGSVGPPSATVEALLALARGAPPRQCRRDGYGCGVGWTDEAGPPI